MPKKTRKKKRWVLKAVLLGGGLAIAYGVAVRQRPGPCIPAGGADERILVKDEENLSGLGLIMQSLISEMLKEEPKLELLDTMNLIVSIQPVEQPETAVTLSFSDGYVVIEPGVVPGPDILIITDYDSLMKMAGMGSGLSALKFLCSPEGKELARRYYNGDIQVKGVLAHPIGMMRFGRFLSPAPGGSG